MGERAGRNGRTALVVIVVLSLVVSATATALVAQRAAELRDAERERERGEFVLEISLITIDGEMLNISDFKARGRPVLVDLMATWCGVCRMQMPMMNATYNAYKDKIDFVSIDTDWYETDEDLREYRDDYGAEWDFAMDRAGSAFGAFYPDAYPTLIIIDRDGRVVFSHDGAITQADLLKAVQRVV